MEQFPENDRPKFLVTPFTIARSCTLVRNQQKSVSFSDPFHGVLFPRISDGFITQNVEGRITSWRTSRVTLSYSEYPYHEYSCPKNLCLSQLPPNWSQYPIFSLEVWCAYCILLGVHRASGRRPQRRRGKAEVR